MLSPQAAAKKAKVSRKTIMNHILSMKLPATRNNENNWVIRPADLSNWMSERNPRRYSGIIATTNESTTPVAMVNPTSEQEVALLKATMLLEHTQKELLITKEDQERLRAEVSELKMEINHSRKDIFRMTKLISQMAVKMMSQSDQPAKTNSKRFLLTPEMRIEADSNEILNIFTDTIGDTATDT